MQSEATAAEGVRHWKLGSMVQDVEQPSPLTELESSHTSSATVKPSPHSTEAHEKEPGVLMQIVLDAHTASAHSSMSAQKAGGAALDSV